MRKNEHQTGTPNAHEVLCEAVGKVVKSSVFSARIMPKYKKRTPIVSSIGVLRYFMQLFYIYG
jgi:hypothetical protein